MELCEGCSCAKATTLVYHVHIQPETGRQSFLGPKLVCEKCRAEIKGTYWALTLALMQSWSRIQIESYINQLTSRAGKDRNDFWGTYWRDRLWNIWKESVDDITAAK